MVGRPVAMDSELSLLRIQAVFAERGRGAMSLETRWMLPGPLPIAMIEWLGPSTSRSSDARISTSSTLRARS